MGGAQTFLRCNPGFVPSERMGATCVSPDGISAVGTWTPDPADLVCNGESNGHIDYFLWGSDFSGNFLHVALLLV